MDLRAVCLVRAIVFYVSDFCAERTKKAREEERKIEFFLKKDLRFLFVSSLGATVLLSRLGGEKNESDGPEALDSSSPRLLAVFAEENSWSRSTKKEQKNECVVVSSFIYNERERHNNKLQSTTLRATNNLIRILINGDERESLHVIR